MDEDRISVSPTSASVHELWRYRDPAAVMAMMTSRRSAIGALCASLAGLRLLACEVAEALDTDERFALVEAGTGFGAGMRDSLATDLLASALLIEALLGCGSARMALAHMRRQRRLRAIVWTCVGPANGSEVSAAEQAADALAAP